MTFFFSSSSLPGASTIRTGGGLQKIWQADLGVIIFQLTSVTIKMIKFSCFVALLAYAVEGFSSFPTLQSYVARTKLQNAPLFGELRFIICIHSFVSAFVETHLFNEIPN